MTSRPRRWRVEPTDEWEQVELLCGWPEQRDYELIRPLVLFGISILSMMISVTAFCIPSLSVHVCEWKPRH
jgi:hypothetical protein